MTKRPDTTFYYSVPRWDGAGSVVLHTFPTAYPDRTHVRRRTRPAFFTCHICRQPMLGGQREYQFRHLRHFRTEYVPLWTWLAPHLTTMPKPVLYVDTPDPAREGRQPKERPVSPLFTVFIALVWLAVVGYLVWTLWDALSRVGK